MSDRFEAFLRLIQRALLPLGKFAAGLAGGFRLAVAGAWRSPVRLATAAVLAALGYGVFTHPPFAAVHRGEVLVRSNVFDGSSAAWSAGTVLVFPGIQQARRYPTRDQVYRPIESARAAGPAPFQSNEGLSLGVDLTVRWAIDRSRIAQMSREYPDDLNADLVRPAVQGVIYPLLARYSVREIFSSKRAQIQEEMSRELRPKLAAIGLLLRGVDMGQVDLPEDYRAEMEKLLAEELETEKMRYTLQLKEAQVRETQLVAEADKVRRQKAAEAAGEEQVIAARAQEETMKHILPFKQKARPRRAASSRAVKPTRARSSPMPRPTGSRSSAKATRVRCSARAP
jgi:regulator of protease activity HflC (stomatin/prohibitin superfamily)